MSTPRAATETLARLGRQSLKCTRPSLAKSFAIQSRASVSTTSWKASSPPIILASHSSRGVSESARRFETRSVLSQSRRTFSATKVTSHTHVEPPKPGEELYVTFTDKDGDEHRLAVSEGDDLLSIAKEHDIEMEGACEGSLSCSTCHVIVEDEKLYDLMPEATDLENDMLDLAFGLTETSRLGCQILMTKELDGLKVKLPSKTRNLQASDFESSRGDSKKN